MDKSVSVKESLATKLRNMLNLATIDELLLLVTSLLWLLGRGMIGD